MAIDYAELKSELINDPQGLGYAPLYANGQDQDLANILNTIHVGGAFQIDNEPVTREQVVRNIDATDLDAMSASNLTKLMVLFLMGHIDLANVATRTLLSSVFPANGVTRTNLIALAKRQGTRGEKLFGNGVRLSASDIALARQQP